MYHPAPAVKRNYLCNVKTHRFFALAGLLQIPLCSADQPVLLGRVYGGSGALQHPLAAGLYLADDDGAIRLPQHKIQLSHAGMIVMRQQLRALLPDAGPRSQILVAGLGNRAMTPDAIGPAAVENLLVTRHMVRALPRQFAGFTSVAALAPGVLAATGMETLELLRGAVQATGSAAVIAIDALAARSRDRLCATVQLGDTGLIPGSGVGNHRKAINAETLGVPVVAVGVPTVIAASLLGEGTEDDDPLFLTPRDIDEKVRELGRLIGYGITLALQEGLTVEDVTGLLG